MKLTLALAAAVAATLVGLPAHAAPASATPMDALVRGDLPTDYVQYRRFGHRHGWRGGRGYGRSYGYRRGYGHRRGPGVGAAVGAGVVGLAAGAIIGGAIANSQAQAAPVVVQGGLGPEAVAACARRFRSYDASSGTYLSNDGARHACP
ncbi:BA14K family protein [Methylobacterium sp. E-045]|uniref:BA14K family protein n=1 Tax=Methylobacterium sp. E-045 TaxID=2836575 RepID=UPI001FB8B628|nr:BA14K family protein [Methylobacterium sp. E-045]MCJ2129765.1 BA14K family protein [Methylobacterium sp. E-045]